MSASSYISCNKGRVGLYFNETYKCDSSGRVMVELIFKRCVYNLENTRKSALVRFLQLERKFGKDVTSETSYVEFMNEYRDLRHKELACSRDNVLGVYTPHHAIFKPNS